ncbi:iron chelate uptake ABC transporter family permease subunit [Haploplasma modicum]|uniref:iron chelate uptake ABC transporter family permease subunit n=1 Tax=Haploplasma modicum TaxID=2150 RepID=UPI00214B0C88|nr:iron chelate uptake ABC transporter family permease subunit [Haploplasma modicum]MCR1809031.1 iron chelate uptake ABC transporter family permease subunit [Haploplasma modicum]
MTKKKYLGLAILAILSIITFMLVWIFKYRNLIDFNNIDKELLFVLLKISRRRFIQMTAIIISIVLISISSLSFQTITNNRILTPSVLGFDSIFIITQTLIVAFLGTRSILYTNDTLNFVLTTSVMILVVLVMLTSLLRKNKNNIILLLLLGLVVTSLASSMSNFIQVLMNPEDFQQVISMTNVSINAINEKLVLPSLVAAIILVFLFFKERNNYDVMALGEDVAKNLGVNYNKKTNKTLILVTISTAIATALVGPLAFLGLIVVNLARELSKSNKHRTLMVVSSLLAVILMLGGHVILEIINLKTPVTIIVNLIGGTYMIYLLVKENIHD